MKDYYDLRSKIAHLIDDEWKYSWHWPDYSYSDTKLEDKALENAESEIKHTIERLAGLQKAVDLIKESIRQKKARNNDLE